MTEAETTTNPYAPVVFDGWEESVLDYARRIHRIRELHQTIEGAKTRHDDAVTKADQEYDAVVGQCQRTLADERRQAGIADFELQQHYAEQIAEREAFLMAAVTARV